MAYIIAFCIVMALSISMRSLDRRSRFLHQGRMVVREKYYRVFNPWTFWTGTCFVQPVVEIMSEQGSIELMVDHEIFQKLKCGDIYDGEISVSGLSNKLLLFSAEVQA